MNWNLFKREHPNIWDAYFDRYKTDVGGNLYEPGSHEPVDPVPRPIVPMFLEAAAFLEDMLLEKEPYTPQKTQVLQDRPDKDRELLPKLNSIILNTSMLAVDTATIEVSNNVSAMRRVRRGLIKLVREIDVFKAQIVSIKRDTENKRKIKNEQQKI